MHIHSSKKINKFKKNSQGGGGGGCATLPNIPKLSVFGVNDTVKTNKDLGMSCYIPGLGSSTVDQVLKYTKYSKYIPSTSTGQVLNFLKST